MISPEKRYVWDNCTNWSLVRHFPFIKATLPQLLTMLSADEHFKGTFHMVDYFRDLDAVVSQDPLTTAFNRAHNTPLHFFAWCEQPGNENRFRRFGIAMKGSSKAFTVDTALNGALYFFIVYIFNQP